MFGAVSSVSDDKLGTKTFKRTKTNSDVLNFLTDAECSWFVSQSTLSAGAVEYTDCTSAEG